jgi:two-component system nitrogen regulation response regulator NtrX
VIERTIILAPAARIGSIEIDMLPPEILNEHAQLSPGEAVKAIMGTPLREARETFEREYLRVQIRRFRETSPAPRASSAWSVPRCTAN